MLEAALDGVARGAGQLALIKGEAGIGKTTLVTRFVQPHRDALPVLWGACDALFTPRPLGPLHDMVAHTQGELPALLDSNANRSAIFSALLAELQRRPTIAVLEDVHWADEATLDVLRFLSRRIARTAALLIVTYRDDELGLQHPLRSVLGDIATLPTTHHISVQPLSRDAVQRLVGPRPIDAAALHRQTGGNPFYVTEVLAYGGQQAPPTVRDAVLARIARLSPAALAVLQAAALIGPRIEPWVLAEVTGAEAQAAEECLAIGMLTAQGDLLAFRHELARQTILALISPPRRSALHRLALAALRMSPHAASELTRLAYHAEGAYDRAAVLQYAPAAARQAASVSAHHEAAKLYALALRHADDLPVPERASLLEAYAWECSVIDRRAEGIAARQEALALWRTVGNLRKQGECLAQLVAMLRAIGQNLEAEQCSRAAIELLETLPAGRELALAYRMQAVLRLANRDNAEAIAWGENAVAVAERCNDQDVAAMAHVAVGAAQMMIDYERGCAYLERRLAVARAANCETHAANVLVYLGSCSVELHMFEQAARYLEQGIAYTADRDLDSIYFAMLAWQALTQLYRGCWNEAATAARQALLRPNTAAISRIPALVATGRLYARRGDPQAQRTLDEALELAAVTGTLLHLALVHAARAECAWLAGDCERARAEARAVYDRAVDKRHAWFAGELAMWRWRAGERVSLPPWAARPFALTIAGDWRGAAEEWRRLGCPYEQAGALAEGDDEAQTQALGIFERLGAQAAADSLRRKMRDAGTLRIPRGPRPATRENPFNLTVRQMDILNLLAVGLSNAEIAAHLYISPKTVDHHVSAVLAKLDVPSRTAAAELLRQHPRLSQHRDGRAPI